MKELLQEHLLLELEVLVDPDQPHEYRDQQPVASLELLVAEEAVVAVVHHEVKMNLISDLYYF